MKITNKQADALESNLTTTEFGKAMSELDLESIPEHKRKKAVMDRLMQIMAKSIKDKFKAQEIHISRILRNRGK